MIVIASVPAVVRAAKFASELAARVAVTTPVVLSAIAFSSAIDGVSLIVTAASRGSYTLHALTTG